MCPIEKKPRHPLTPHAASTCAERKSLTKCDAFSWPPIGTGRFEQLIGVEWVFLGFTRGGQYLSQIAHLNPLTGSVALADCDESSFVADCENTQLANDLRSLASQRAVPSAREASARAGLLAHSARRSFFFLFRASNYSSREKFTQHCSRHWPPSLGPSSTYS